MTTYDEYVDHITRLAAPVQVPDHMPVAYAAMLGRPIENIVHDKEFTEEMRISFVGGGTLRIWDNGQSCCETRYMTTDDDLPSFIGAKVVGLEDVAAPDIPYEGESYGDVHEQRFVKLETTAGTITLVTHNQHNGYYGGFDVVAKWED